MLFPLYHLYCMVVLPPILIILEMPYSAAIAVVTHHGRVDLWVVITGVDSETTLQIVPKILACVVALWVDSSLPQTLQNPSRAEECSSTPPELEDIRQKAELGQLLFWLRSLTARDVMLGSAKDDGVQ